jgi:hypothetical protein
VKNDVYTRYFTKNTSLAPKGESVKLLDAAPEAS